MKHEVLLKKKQLTVSDLESNEYVGFIANGAKWFIFYAERKLMAISFDKKGHYAQIKTPNEIYTHDECKTVEQCLSKQYGVTQVFKFDTKNELFLWLAE